MIGADIDDCAGSNDCQNGVCRDGVNTYTCDCTAGYMGDLCERGNVEMHSHIQNSLFTFEFIYLEGFKLID